MTIQKLCGLSLLMTAMALSGCSSMKNKGGASGPDSGTTPSSASADTAGIGQADPRTGLVVQADASDAAAARTAQARAAKAGLTDALRVLHFDFDSATLSEGDRGLLQQHAAFLKSHGDVTARLEGHADERGTQEYNMALGERRARAAALFLRSEGVQADRLDVISYGETKPIASGGDDESWARNRRVEISYR